MNKTSIYSIITFLIFEGILLFALWDIIQTHQWNRLGIVSLAIGILVLPFILTWLANRLKSSFPLDFRFSLWHIFFPLNT